MSLVCTEIGLVVQVNDEEKIGDFYDLSENNLFGGRENV